MPGGCANRIGLLSIIVRKQVISFVCFLVYLVICYLLHLSFVSAEQPTPVFSYLSFIALFLIKNSRFLQLHANQVSERTC